MGDQLKRVFESPRVMVIGKRIENAERDRDDGALKLARKDKRTRAAAWAFVENSRRVTDFRRLIEDEMRCTVNEVSVRGVARICLVFYNSGEMIPRARDILDRSLGLKSTEGWVKANSIQLDEIRTGLRVIDFLGFSFQEGGGAKRWVSTEKAEEIMKQGKNNWMHCLSCELGKDSSDSKILKILDFTYDKLELSFFWVLGRR